MQQKLSAVLILVLALFSACNKSHSTQTPEPEKPQVSMRYSDLSGKILTHSNTAFHIDLDQDGNTDINVKIEPTAETSTQLYRLKYAVSTGLGNYLLVDGNEQTPSFNANQQYPQGIPRLISGWMGSVSAWRTRSPLLRERYTGKETGNKAITNICRSCWFVNLGNTLAGWN